jgi:transcriptional regulator with XRE-family HTH domain
VNDFASVLKVWRKARRFSQLGLAMEAQVSARHIAFLETKRAKPSTEMISKLCAALQLPLSAHNQMLTSAGFAVRFPQRPLADKQLAPIQAAIHYLLERHAPYPAIAVNKLWTVVSMNRPATVLFGQLGISPGTSLLDVMVSKVFQNAIENWPEVAHYAVARLRTESAAQGGVAALDFTANALSRGLVAVDEKKPLGVAMPTIFKVGEFRLALFSLIAQFGTPEDVTVDDLKIELYFPSDEATENALR